MNIKKYHKKMGGKFCYTITRKEFLKRTTGCFVSMGISGLTAPAFIKKSPAVENIEYRILGKTGLKVTPVGLGASRTNEPSVFNRAVNLGINFIDTGRMYSEGRNEEIIGKVIEGIRKNVIIQSKIDQKTQEDKTAMEKSIDDSLKALRTYYIDILTIRGTTTEKAVKNPAVIEVFGKAKEAGKGFSCHSTNSPEMLKIGVEMNVYDVAMIPYNHSGSFHHVEYGIYSEWDQDDLEQAFEHAAAHGMGIIYMKTCSDGPLKTQEDINGSFLAALKWILRNKNIGTMAVGMASFRELNEDVRAMG